MLDYYQTINNAAKNSRVPDDAVIASVTPMSPGQVVIVPPHRFAVESAMTLEEFQVFHKQMQNDPATYGANIGNVDLTLPIMERIVQEASEPNPEVQYFYRMRFLGFMTPAPHYWMHEVSGILSSAITRLVHDQRLTVRDIRLIRAYLQQWIDAPLWDANPHSTKDSRQILKVLRVTAAQIETIEQIHGWIAVAVDNGLDPL